MTKRHVLGQEYYTVTQEGVIEKKAIMRLPFRLPQRGYWSAARALKKARVQTKKALEFVDSKSKEQLMQQRLTILQSSPETHIENLPIVDGDLFHTPGIDFKPESLTKADIPAAEDIFTVGQKVWLPVTPKTHMTVTEGFRPAQYFVLETYVREVSLQSYYWTGGWRLFYDIDSNYSLLFNPGDLCDSKEAAIARLCELLELQAPVIAVPEKVKTFYRYQEKAHDKKVMDEITKRHKRVSRVA